MRRPASDRNTSPDTPTAAGAGSASVSAAAGPSPIEAFLRRCEAPVKAMLSRYEVAPDDAELLLQQALLVLVYRFEDLADPEAWLLATLRQHCRRYRGVDAAKADSEPGEVAAREEKGPR